MASPIRHNKFTITKTQDYCSCLVLVLIFYIFLAHYTSHLLSYVILQRLCVNLCPFWKYDIAMGNPCLSETLEVKDDIRECGSSVMFGGREVNQAVSDHVKCLMLQEIDNDSQILQLKLDLGAAHKDLPMADRTYSVRLECSLHDSEYSNSILAYYHQFSFLIWMATLMDRFDRELRVV